MLKKVAIVITRKWLNLGIITSDLYECYLYGVEAILMELLSLIIIILLGVLTHSIETTIIFLIVFISIRKFIGGYHADSNLRCNIIMSMLFLISVFVTKFNSKELAIVLNIVAFFVVLISFIGIGPIGNKNKTLDKSKIKKGKIISFHLFIVYYVISILLCKQQSILSITISVTLIEIAVLLVIGKLVMDKTDCTL